MIRFSVFSSRADAIQIRETAGVPYASVDIARLFGSGAEEISAVTPSLRITANITLRAAGSMRFRWNETNPVRERFFSALGISEHAVPLELIHSKTVFACANAAELHGARGDGIITANPRIAPVITVADCMPVYLANFKIPCFGVLHSGWKGTGIAREALELARRDFGARTEDFFVVLGPHIQNCCYIVDKERADFFARNFSPECVDSLHLSLAEANLHILASCGVPDNHIAVCADCTSCDTRLGSFRREAARLDLPLEEKIKHITAMAAWAAAA